MEKFDIGFDLNGLSHPKTADDFVMLLDEALSIADDIQVCLDGLHATLSSRVAAPV